ncbi:MAG: Branched-chain amino acid transport protein (AzlD) [Halomonas sp. HL-48]|nr:MAG: Branched-chain amino acid transport protein (AzlD) [Halomonas sp. HL-48]
MASGVPTSAQRVSSALGLCIVMLATLPRYMAGGNETRLSLIIMALVIVLVAVGVQWRMLSATERRKLPGMCKRLAAMMGIGVLVMGAWHALFTDWISWQVFISHAATFGLIAHVISLWWATERRDASPR